MNAKSPYLHPFIAEIAVFQTATAHSPEDFKRNFAGLGTAFFRSVKVYWLFPAGGSSLKNHSSFRSEDLTVQPVPVAGLNAADSSSNSKWLQDPFWVQDGESPAFLLPSTAPAVDCKIVSALAQASGFPIREFSGHLEGGNMRSYREHLFLGKDLILKHQVKMELATYWEARSEMNQQIKSCLQSPRITWIGSPRPVTRGPEFPAATTPTFQTFFHLDLYFLPCGEDDNGIPCIAIGEVLPEWTIGSTPSSAEIIAQLSASVTETVRQVRQHFLNRVHIVRLPFYLHLKNQSSTLMSHCNGLLDGNSLLLPDFIPENPFESEKSQVQSWQQHNSNLLNTHHIAHRFVTQDFYSKRKKCGALNCLIKVIRYHNS